MLLGRSAVRAQQWWDYKIPPLIATATIVLAASRPTGGVREVAQLVLFLVAAVGIAAFGHVLNDIADIDGDTLAGKRNVMSMVSTRGRILTVLVTLVVGLMPFVWLPHPRVVVVLVTVEVALLGAYSVPPVRLKGRAFAGVLADAAYAYLIPIALTIAVYAARSGAPTIRWWAVAPVLVWSFLMGVRGIVSHQIDDLANDRAAGVSTLVAAVGRDRSVRWASRSALVELVVAALAIAAVSVATDNPWLAIFGLAYLVWRLLQVSFLWSDPLLPRALHDEEARLRLVGFVLLNEFAERWLPLAALVALSIDRPAWWFATAAYLVAFDNALVEFVSRDARTLPDAAERLASELRARRLIRRAAANRRSAAARGPAEVTPRDRDRRRWVFVVCGPEMHVRTLHTALANLRPLTSLEIWVITDLRRNEVEIDPTGADRIVDVRTPSELDDHQASIWLKTSLHRHVPSGEWCYLDTDIIAIAPAVEEVFDHRRGPVAFASDLTIATNQVDRFSPWAMTCDCAGLGDDHSCAHLREQLRIRFDLDVPGDWLHWNGGVFVFGPDAGAFLDMWHERSVASFDWPEWRTRDQGALIATAWSSGLQDLPRLPATFNFIVDLGNGDLCHDPDRGWALHPSGPWSAPRLLHLYTSPLEEEDWDLGRDVEAVVIRQGIVRTQRWKRGEQLAAAERGVGHVKGWFNPTLDRFHPTRWAATNAVRRWSWRTTERVGLYRLRLLRLPRRLHPRRVNDSIRRRTRPDGSS